MDRNQLSRLNFGLASKSIIDFWIDELNFITLNHVIIEDEIR